MTIQSNYTIEDVPTTPVADSRPAWVDEPNYAIVNGRLHSVAKPATFIKLAPGRVDRWTGERLEPPKAQPTPEDDFIASVLKEAGVSDAPKSAPDSVHAQMRRERLFSRTASKEDVVELASDPILGDVAVSLTLRAELLDLAKSDADSVDLAAGSGAQRSALDDWCGRHADLARPSVPAIELSRSGPSPLQFVDLADPSADDHRLVQVGFLVDGSTSVDRLLERLRRLFGAKTTVHTPIV